MTISRFANDRGAYFISTAQAYREQKRLEAEERQLEFRADIQRVMHEQRVDYRTAYSVACASRRTRRAALAAR